MIDNNCGSAYLKHVRFPRDVRALHNQLNTCDIRQTVIYITIGMCGPTRLSRSKLDFLMNLLMLTTAGRPSHRGVDRNISNVLGWM